jgi:thiamine pyrophosphokinase
VSPGELVVVVAGSEAPVTDPPGPAPSGYVIAADSGLDRARAWGWPVHLVVGDLDSASPEAIAAARRAGAEIDHHPVAKDQTDLELALDRAVARGPRRIVVVGSGGGRLDHLLAGALVLASDRYAAVPISAWLDGALVTVIRGTVILIGEPGSLVTLVPVGGPARGVTLEGMRYPLSGEDLAAGTGRGVSNELLGRQATVRVATGVLLAVQPAPATIPGWT